MRDCDFILLARGPQESFFVAMQGVVGNHTFTLSTLAGACQVRRLPSGETLTNTQMLIRCSSSRD